MMIKLYFYLTFIGFLILAGCATVPKAQETKAVEKSTLSRNSQLKNFEMTLNLNVNMTSGSNSASAKAKVADTDSIALSLFGPFGIPVGKVYADMNQLIFLNLLTNQVLKGKPSEENMRTAIMLPMSYSDFIRLIRCETPGNPLDFIFERNLNDTESLYKNSSNSEFIEYAVISNSTKEIMQYQRKAIDGSMILHVFYSDYKLFDNINFSTKQLYKFPGINADLSLEVNDFKNVINFDSPFMLKIPKGMEVIDLEQR